MGNRIITFGEIMMRLLPKLVLIVLIKLKMIE